MTMMNENAASITRPVTMKDIAEKLGLSVGTVKQYLSPKYHWNGTGVQLVRKTAEEMGYDPKAVLAYTGALRKGKSWKWQRHTEKSNPTPSPRYNGGNFFTKEEEMERMKELRDMGYSNVEIARKVGRSYLTVLVNIGKQDPELSQQNREMAQKYRAQKNAARKQYLVNKPIREYNKRVKEHNDLKAKIAQMEMELKPQIPAIEKAAQTKIEFPMMKMETIQPVAFQ